jgi:hypothetical protein
VGGTDCDNWIPRLDFLYAFQVAQASCPSKRLVGGTDWIWWVAPIGFSLRFPSCPGLLSFQAIGGWHRLDLIGGWHRLDLVGGTDWIFSTLSKLPRPPVLPRDWWVAPIGFGGWHRLDLVGGTDWIFLVKGGWHRLDFLQTFHVSQASCSSSRKVGGTDWIKGGWHRLDFIGGDASDVFASRWIEAILGCS